MSRQNFKPGALMAPLPAVMVSVGDESEKNIITIGWTGILSTDPPRLYISVRPSRHSHEILMRTREFAVNLVSSDLALACDYAGIYSGKKVDKFEKCNLHPSNSKCISAPGIEESPLTLECRVFDIISSGTHDIFMADIVNISCRDDIIDDNGRIRYDKANLICYAHGEYFGMGRFIGRFGYSTDKKNKGRVGVRSSREALSGNKNTDAPTRRTSGEDFGLKAGKSSFAKSKDSRQKAAAPSRKLNTGKAKDDRKKSGGDNK